MEPHEITPEEVLAGGHADYSKEHQVFFLRMKFGDAKVAPGFKKVKDALRVCWMSDKDIRQFIEWKRHHLGPVTDDEIAAFLRELKA